MAYQEDGSYPLPDVDNTEGTYAIDPYNGMPPPNEGAFPSLQDLLFACQDHARANGYACVTASNNYKRGIAYVRCDRGGEYVNHWKLTPETRVRKNRTRRLVRAVFPVSPPHLCSFRKVVRHVLRVYPQARHQS